MMRSPPSALRSSASSRPFAAGPTTRRAPAGRGARRRAEARRADDRPVGRGVVPAAGHQSGRADHHVARRAGEHPPRRRALRRPAARPAGDRVMKLYHRSPEGSADRIMAVGFRDGTSTAGRRGVWLSSGAPLDSIWAYGCPAVIEVDTPTRPPRDGRGAPLSARLPVRAAGSIRVPCAVGRGAVTFGSGTDLVSHPSLTMAPGSARAPLRWGAMRDAPRRLGGRSCAPEAWPLASAVRPTVGPNGPVGAV